MHIIGPASARSYKIGVLGNNWLVGWLIGWLVGNSVFSKSKMSLLVTTVKAWSKELHLRLYGSPRYDSEEFEGLNMI